MKTITLAKIIQRGCKDPVFNQHFQRELLINEIAKAVTQLRCNAKFTQQKLAESVIARLESGSAQRVPSLELLA